MNERPAKGAHGFIMRDVDGTVFFRVYDSPAIGAFTDYDIASCDFEVEILDECASFYDDTKVLDYDSRTLGLVPVEKEKTDEEKYEETYGRHPSR